MHPTGSFIKNVGAKVFGIGKTTAEESADVVCEKASKLINAVEILGFEVLDLKYWSFTNT